MSNNVLILIVALIIIIFNGGIFFFIFKNMKSKKDDETGKDSGLQLLLQQINELSRTVDMRVGDVAKTVDLKMSDISKTVDGKLNESQRQMQDTVRYQTNESFKLLKDVTERLVKLDETNKQVVSFADQLKSLQDILKNPKQRGILGEYYLETLLKNVLPVGSFQMQYAFKDNTIVDAVVFVKEKIIPIDSKFSLENYNRLTEEKDSVEDTIELFLIQKGFVKKTPRGHVLSEVA